MCNPFYLIRSEEINIAWDSNIYNPRPYYSIYIIYCLNNISKTHFDDGGLCKQYLTKNIFSNIWGVIGDLEYLIHIFNEYIFHQHVTCPITSTQDILIIYILLNVECLPNQQG